MRSFPSHTVLTFPLRNQYDVKKIEEVVYDISLRGLIKGQDDGHNGVAYSTGAESQQHLITRLAGQT